MNQLSVTCANGKFEFLWQPSMDKCIFIAICNQSKFIEMRWCYLRGWVCLFFCLLTGWRWTFRATWASCKYSHILGNITITQQLLHVIRLRYPAHSIDLWQTFKAAVKEDYIMQGTLTMWARLITLDVCDLICLPLSSVGQREIRSSSEYRPLTLFTKHCCVRQREKETQLYLYHLCTSLSHVCMSGAYACVYALCCVCVLHVHAPCNFLHKSIFFCFQGLPGTNGLPGGVGPQGSVVSIYLMLAIK